MYGFMGFEIQFLGETIVIITMRNLTQSEPHGFTLLLNRWPLLESSFPFLSDLLIQYEHSETTPCSARGYFVEYTASRVL